MSDIQDQLSKPFKEKDVSWRVGATTQDKTKGIALAYIDARDVMLRLDEVFGLDWQCRYSHAGDKTVCEIGVKIGNEWIWRADGAGDTKVEEEKGALSDAFKRAAVRFGIGRYLYYLPQHWVELDANKRIANRPALPVWATPEGWEARKRKRDSGGIVTPAAGGVFEALTEEQKQAVLQERQWLTQAVNDGRIDDAKAEWDIAFQDEPDLRVALLSVMDKHILKKLGD